MRTVIASAILIAIGAVEAIASLDQLDAAGARPRLGGSGLAIGALGLLASAAVYVALGRLAASERAAVRSGGVTGALAGAIGGTLRAAILGDVVTYSVERYASVPDWFVPAVLAVFVVGALFASAAAGALIAWLTYRLTPRSPRPPA
jgi:hypothetical protein